jgi:CBS domain-containing protein
MKGALNMQVHELMTRQVESVDADTPIAKAAEKMRLLNIGFLPICENDRLVGTLTDRDITIRSVAQGRDPRLAPVREIMSLQVFYCYEDDDVETVANVMREREVRRIIILNREKRLAGVVSLGDLAKASGERELAAETLGSIAEAA